MKPALHTLQRFAMSILLLVGLSLAVCAQREHTDTLSVTINFRQGYATLDLGFMGNREALERFVGAYDNLPHKPSTIHIIGYASPEGTVSLNQRLSRKRAAVIADYLKTHCNISADSIVSVPIGVDWQDLYTAVQADPKVPARESVLDIIANVTDTVRDSRGQLTSQRNRLLKRLEDGRTWSYMLTHIYPHLRGAKAEVVCTVELPEPEETQIPVAEPETPADSTAADTEPVVTQPTLSQAEKRALPGAPIYCSLHTNTIYDVLGVPNIGAELNLGKRVSIAANWWYSWWKNDPKHRYWRTYGGYIAPRYWIGKAAGEKPLTGHHAGVYAQIALYDFELGGIGYLSGDPGKNIFHHPTWAAGLEYGFALPVTKRLNIDFTVGMGYLWGRYEKYKPVDDQYICLSINDRKWLGPTKLEMSLVWLLGRDNVNGKKGGTR